MRTLVQKNIAPHVGSQEVVALEDGLELKQTFQPPSTES